MDSKKKEIRKAIIGMFALFGVYDKNKAFDPGEKELLAARADFYVNALEKHGLEDVLKAIKGACESCEFIPKPVSIIKLLKPSDGAILLKADEQWKKFLEGVMHYPQPKFEDKITTYLAQGPCNIYEIKQNSTDKNIEFVRLRFIEEYKAAAKMEELPGADRTLPEGDRKKLLDDLEDGMTLAGGDDE